MSVHAKQRMIVRDDAGWSVTLPKLSLPAQRRALRLVLLASDGAMLILSLVIASVLRFGLEITLHPEIDMNHQLYAGVMVALLPVWLACFALSRVYDFRFLLGGTEEYARVFNACSVGILLIVIFSFLAPSLVISRAWLVFVWLSSVLLVIGARFGWRRVVYRLRQRGYFVAPALIVGVNDEAMALGEQLASWSTSGLLLRGFVHNGPAGDPLPAVASKLPVLGHVDNLSKLVHDNHIHELIVATSAVSGDHLLDIFRRYGSSDKVNLRLSSGLFASFTTGLYVKELGFVSLISVNKVRLTPQEAFVKRCADIIGAALGLVLLAPLFAVIAVAIRRDSPGPVIYRRRVLGRGGKVFDAFKFRSMYIDGDDMLTLDEWAELQTSHKLRNDPRVTPVGRFIRKYSLDELPQLVNVLLGQMALIGPRMITPAEQEKYGRWDKNLLTVKPGLSGLWQVSGRSDVSYEERVNMDMQYIRNYSAWLDIQLFFQTIAVVLKGDGAY